MRQCFGFVLEIVFAVEGCFCYFWSVFIQHQGLFCPSLQPAINKVVGTQELGRNTGRPVHPTDQSGIPFHMAPHPVCKIKGKKTEGEMSAGMAFAFLNNCYSWAWLSWEWLNIPLLMRRDEWILFFSACKYDFCFISIYPTSFLAFPVLSLIAPEGSEWLPSTQMLAGVKNQQFFSIGQYYVNLLTI